MNIKRLLDHLLYPAFLRRRVFSSQALQAIEQAIRESETRHQGELRFVVEAALHMPSLLDNESARERAIELFSQLRIWDTEHNSGVLIYLLLADRRVEIIADRGINRYAGENAWQSICRDMEQALRQGRFEEGVVTGIRAITPLLTAYCPAQADNPNELPDQPVVL